MLSIQLNKQIEHNQATDEILGITLKENQELHRANEGI